MIFKSSDKVYTTQQDRLHRQVNGFIVCSPDSTTNVNFLPPHCSDLGQIYILPEFHTKWKLDLVYVLRLDVEVRRTTNSNFCLADNSLATRVVVIRLIVSRTFGIWFC